MVSEPVTLRVLAPVCCPVKPRRGHPNLAATPLVAMASSVIDACHGGGQIRWDIRDVAVGIEPSVQGLEALTLPPTPR